MKGHKPSKKCPPSKRRGKDRAKDVFLSKQRDLDWEKVAPPFLSNKSVINKGRLSFIEKQSSSHKIEIER